MKESLDLSQLITPAEAARLSGRTRQAIYRLIAVGKLASVQVGGRDFVFREAVEAFEFSKAGRPAKTTTRKSAKATKKARS